MQRLKLYKLNNIKTSSIQKAVNFTAFFYFRNMKTTTSLIMLFATLSLMGYTEAGLLPKSFNQKKFSAELRYPFNKYWLSSTSDGKKYKYGHYIENNFGALAVHATSVNRATFALGSTYQMRYCYNNADKSKKDIYRVLSIDNDLMLEFLLSDKNHVNMGLLFSSTCNYRIQGLMNYPMIGVQLRTSPAIMDSYAVMPMLGFTNLLRDVYYGYTTYASGLYANYSKHNIGVSFRFSELLEAFNQK